MISVEAVKTILRAVACRQSVEDVKTILRAVACRKWLRRARSGFFVFVVCRCGLRQEVRKPRDRR